LRCTSDWAVPASVAGFDDVQIIFQGAFRVRVARLPRGSRAPLRRAARQVGFRHRRDRGHPFGRGRRRRLHCARIRAPPSLDRLCSGRAPHRSRSASSKRSPEPATRSPTVLDTTFLRHSRRTAASNHKSSVAAHRTRCAGRRSPKIRHRGSWPPDQGTGPPLCTRTFTATRGRHH
jgi:hypothetical protein